MRILFILACTLFFTLNLYAVTGTVYEMGSNQKKVLYTLASTSEIKDGVEVFNMKFYDPEGNVVIDEVAHFKDSKVVNYTVDYKRRNQMGGIKIEEGKLKFSYTKEGKTKTDEESLTANYVVGLSVKRYLHAHWDQLLKGEKVKVRFGVPDRRETVGFSYFRLKDKEKPGGRIIVKMKPSSWVIAALVDPLIFEFDPKTRDLLKVIGRTKPKQLVDGKWKDLDAETVYDPETPATEKNKTASK